MAEETKSFSEALTSLALPNLTHDNQWRRAVSLALEHSKATAVELQKLKK
jgi:hypothetical protein